ncbi:MAG: hypothetical protein M3N54_06360 [Acidobacteriota bacterium]|nr:hypothetical protein [Acidobacteriota bacterium]
MNDIDLDDSTEPRRDLLPTYLSAVRNDFTGQLTAMDRHDRAAQTKFCAEIVACHKPANALETQVAWLIAIDYWRLNRTRSLEEALFILCHPNPTGDFGDITVDQQIVNGQTHAFLTRQADFKFLSVYEMRIQRTLNRNKAELKQLQAERRQPRPDHHPDENGFAFSTPPTAPEPPLTDAPAVEPPKIRTATATTPQNGFGFSTPPTAPRNPAPTRFRYRRHPR